MDRRFRNLQKQIYEMVSKNFRRYSNIKDINHYIIKDKHSEGKKIAKVRKEGHKNEKVNRKKYR